MINGATDYNNVGICAAGLMSVLRHTETLSTTKALLIMPMVMHAATIRYFSDGRTAPREIAALASIRPDLFANFPSRFSASLATSLNAIQLLASLQFITLQRDLRLSHELIVDESFGKRALKIDIASANIAAVLNSSVDELYLNLRIPL